MDTRRLLATLGAGSLLAVGAIAGPEVLANQPGDMTGYVGFTQQNQQEDEREGADVTITGDALEQASSAALEHTGEGKVTDTEVGDEEGFYEVEVTLNDGSQIDVHLDQNFKVIGDEVDGREDED